MQTLYTAEVHVTGGRIGQAASNDGLLKVELATPKALGGPGGDGTNPEQLFAAGYAACFLSALKLVAGKQKVALPADAAVDAKVGIGPNGQGGFALSASLTVSLPGIAADVGQQLLDIAHQVCPYSNATRGNIPVEIKLA